MEELIRDLVLKTQNLTEKLWAERFERLVNENDRLRQRIAELEKGE